jgi:hypothetical protein
MKKKILTMIALGAITISSCHTYQVLGFQYDKENGTACPSPVYVGTMGKIVSSSTTLGSNGKPITEYNQESLTLYQLLSDARQKYGADVTIQNVRWDMRNKTRISVIYDVIKCK